MIIISLLSLVIVIIAAIRVPSLIIKPIIEFTDKVRSISNKKYSERINITSENELGILARTFNKMAAKLEEFDKSNIELLIAEKKRAEAIVKSMVDGIFVLNENYEILMVNKIGEELLGMFEESIKGRSAFEIARKNNLVENLLQGIDSGGAAWKAPNYLRIFYKNKEEFYLKETVKVTDENKILGYIIILKNVTGFKELDEIKSGFVATVSHELKTPLAAINMSLRLLQDKRIGTLNEEQKRLSQSMKEEVSRLLKMINELLNLSKIESGGEIYRLQDISVEELLDAAVTPMLMQIEQNRIKFEMHVEPNIPKLKIDANKIAWVIINLLNNAVRYTRSEITLNVKTENGFVKFCIKDNGVGIKPEFIDKIFHKFVQVSRTNVESTNRGVGLGLAIAKEFVEAHKGKIWVKSEVDKGSEFCFTIPL
jgi:PAS domain S-box-containing protein